MLKENQKLRMKMAKGIFKNRTTQFIVCCLLFIFIISCNQFWITGILEAADEAQIQFYNKDSADKTISIITIIDKDDLDKIESFISDKEAKPLKCGYDGTIRFKSKGETLIDTEFNLQTDCRHIAFVLNNKVQYRELTDEGFKYLSALKEQ